MPSVHTRGKHSYKLVEDKNDGLGKVPAFDEEAFQLGITFKAKYVGTLEITRPTCRAEIVTAMRKVRYEFKIKGIEKRRVNLTISVEGIKVTVRKRRRRMRKDRALDEEPVILHEHPIGRIFYVSHDSMDLKIFSYITKDNFDNQFRCSVFKAYRKSKALFVVRTIGQAFEVCHRLQQETGEKKEETGQKEQAPKVDAKVFADSGTDIDAVDLDKAENEKDGEVNDVEKKVNVKPTPTLIEITQILSAVGPDGKPLPFTVEQLRVLYNQQLEHYMQETEIYKAENKLLKDQLALERNARTEAQEREHSLIQKNRAMLQTIQALTTRVQMGTSVDDGFNSTLEYSDTTFAHGYPTMFSTPHKDNCLIDLSGFSSMIIPSIPAPSNNEDRPTITNDVTRVAPLAPMENSVDALQTTIGLHWKTFDEDEVVVSPGNGSDESTSDSSEEDDAFSDSFPAREMAPAEKTNGIDDVTMVNGAKAYLQSNGTILNGLQTLQTENNNNLTKTNEVRSAIQTDF